MADATAVFAVLDYLVAACRASSALVDVVVQDGTPLSTNLGGAPKVLVIGGEWQRSDAARSAANASQEPSAGNYSNDEAVSIACTAFGQGGDSDPATHRAEAKAVLNAVKATILADPKLGGLSYGDTRIGSVDDVRPVQNERGGACIVAFTVTTTALLWDG